MCLETGDIYETYCPPWTLENKRKRHANSEDGKNEAQYEAVP